MRRGLLIAGVLALGLAGPVRAATPESATLDPDNRAAEWTGAASPGPETGVGFSGSLCFGPDGQPDPSSGCDFFALTVNVPEDFYRLNPGALDLRVADFGTADLDMWVYERNPDGSAGEFVGGDGDIPGEPEDFVFDKPDGSYWVVVTNYFGPPDQGYKGAANFVLRKKGTIPSLNARAHPGFVNYRASRDSYTSHSEPTIAHGPAGPRTTSWPGRRCTRTTTKYLFKVGTYESFDGGRTWEDHGPAARLLPGAGPVRPEQRGRLPHDVRPDDRLRRRGQRRTPTCSTRPAARPPSAAST